MRYPAMPVLNYVRKISAWAGFTKAYQYVVQHQLTMWLRKEVPSLAQISVATWNQGGVHATLRTQVVRFPDYNPPSSRNLRVGGTGLPQWHMPSLDFNVDEINSEKSLKTWTYVFRQTVI